MTDRVRGQLAGDGANDPIETMASLTDDILPALTARLQASELGELEVRADGWRIRLRRELAMARPASKPAGASGPAAPTTSTLAAEIGVARSPAVGYFTPGRDVAVGQVVRAGDPLGAVDMLGVLHDVPAPRDGVVSRVLAAPGEAVEYGQALVDIVPVGGGDGRTVEPSEPAAGSSAAD